MISKSNKRSVYRAGSMALSKHIIFYGSMSDLHYYNLTTLREHTIKLYVTWGRTVQLCVLSSWKLSPLNAVHVQLLGVMVMVFDATFNNISAILWPSVLLVEENGVPGENDRPVTSH